MIYVRAIIAGIIGAIVGYFATAFLTVIVGDLFQASDFEGALGMLAFLGIGPLGGLAGMLAAIWIALRRGGAHSIGAVARRMPLVLLAIGGIAATAFWLAYEWRPLLGTSASGPPRLDFEIRLPAGATVPSPRSRISVELHTAHNRIAGLVFDRGREEGGRSVLVGSVELHYRSDWRLIEVRLAPGEPARIFDLKLAARPEHMREFGPWRPADFVATREEQPTRAMVSADYEIRTRVVYRDADLSEEAGRAGAKR